MLSLLRRYGEMRFDGDGGARAPCKASTVVGQVRCVTVKPMLTTPS